MLVNVLFQGSSRDVLGCEPGRISVEVGAFEACHPRTEDGPEMLHLVRETSPHVGAHQLRLDDLDRHPVRGRRDPQVHLTHTAGTQLRHQPVVARPAQVGAGGVHVNGSCLWLT